MSAGRARGTGHQYVWPVPSLRRVALAALVVLVVGVSAPTSGATRLKNGCQPGPMPFAGLAGASLSPEVHTSSDPTPVSYVRWRGTAPTFDGMPLSVDVTVPCGVTGALPTVVMNHGFTDDKTVWEETGKSDTVHSPSRPGSNDRWNNIWFASRGYAVLNYTARGWRDSCGPDTPGRTGAGPAPTCSPFQYWIHLDDKRWEVRDAQWLTGGLVQSGIADRRHLAITGGSYGGGPTSMAALLAGKVMCGATATPTTLGPDPCSGRANGDLADWATPDGRTRLDWAAALPLYTFGDLMEVLAPNGRGTDGWDLAPVDASHVQPVGVPLDSTLSGLLLAARSTGSLAPDGADPDSDIARSANRLLAGNPFPRDEPAVADGVRLYRDFKSPITIAPQGRVPIFWVQGLTDALFPALEALSVLNHVKAADARYPFKLFLGDIGHDYAAERVDEWSLAKDQMNEFIDHYLRPDRTPRAPTFDVGATVTRCLDHDAPLRYEHASTWAGLHPSHVTFTSTAAGTTSTGVAGPAAAATDPISTATLPGPNSYRGCRIMRPAQPDPTVVTYEFPIRKDLVLMGGPVVDVTFGTTASDVPLAVRVWDVTADGAVQGLVTRGIYRVDGAPGAALTARFQIADQGYRFAAGHRMKVEVTADDAPYHQASSIPATVTVDRLSLTLPVLGRAARLPRTSDRTAITRSSGRTWLWWVVLVVTVLAIGIVLVLRRGSSRASAPRG